MPERFCSGGIKNVLLEINRLESRSGPAYVGPDFGSSLFAIYQKHWYISILNEMGYNISNIVDQYQLHVLC